MAQEQGLTFEELTSNTPKGTAPKVTAPKEGLTFEELSKPHVSHGASGSWDTPAQVGVKAGLDMAKTQVKNVAEGAKEFFTGGSGPSENYWRGGPKTIEDMEKARGGRNQPKFQGPVATSVKGGIALVAPNAGVQAPSDEEFVQSAKEAGMNAAGLAVGGAIDKMAPAVSARVNKRLAYAQERPLVKFTPEGHLRTALKPDLNDADLLLARQLLTEGESIIGKPIKDVDTAKEGYKAVFEDHLMAQRNDIISKQADVLVPGSAKEYIQAQIDAIPADIRPGTPEYDRLVQRANERTPKDFTIGELGNINSSLNSQTRTFHDAKLGQALSKEESANMAMDIAAERASRRLMDKGMETNGGIGGSRALKDINKRIGITIKMEDALRGAENQARVEATIPRLKRINVSKEVPFVHTGSPTINEHIANSMRKAKTGAPAIPSNITTRVKGIKGEQSDLLPMEGNDPYKSGQQPLLDQPAVTSTGIGPDAVAAQQAAAQAQRAAPPPTLEGQQQSIQGFPGPLGSQTIETKGTYATPEEAYRAELRQRQMWRDAQPQAETGQQPLPSTGNVGATTVQPKGTYATPEEAYKAELRQRQMWREANPDLPEGQIPLQPTVIREGGQPSTELFRIDQPSGKAIPPGTTLSHKTRMLDGTEMWHYATPEGEMIMVDHEIDPAILAPKPKGPAEPGTSWSGESVAKPERLTGAEKTPDKAPVNITPAPTRPSGSPIVTKPKPLTPSQAAKKITVTDAEGNIHIFNTQADAKEFLKDMGLPTQPPSRRSKSLNSKVKNYKVKG